LIGLAVPGRPIRSLVAEDRSAEGVRDRTGPEPSAHKIVNATMREPAGQESLWRDRRTVEHLLRHTTVDFWLRGKKGLERLLRAWRPICREPFGLLATMRWSSGTGVTHGRS
jgi:hypothetical protein